MNIKKRKIGFPDYFVMVVILTLAVFYSAQVWAPRKEAPASPNVETAPKNIGLINNTITPSITNWNNCEYLVNCQGQNCQYRINCR